MSYDIRVRDHDPLDIRGQEASKRECDDKQRLQREIEIDDFKWLMSDKRGRRFIWRLLDMAGVYRSSFTGSSETFFREGQRNVGLMVLNDIHQLCPDDFTRMLKEHKKDGPSRPR